MTIAEILKAKGITDDVIQAIQEEMKTNKIFTASEENLDIRYGKLKTEHEGKVAELQKQLQETKIESAIQIALLSEKVDDVPYLSYKLNEKLKKDGKAIELDDNGNIKGWDDMLSGLKTQFPTHFETSTGDGYRVVDPQKLPRGNGGDAVPTKEDFKAMTYEQRVALKQKNEELYKTLKN